MKIAIIGNGIGHDFQSNKTENDPLAHGKERFEDFIRQQVAENKPDFIGEEALQNADTIAKSLGFEWANIDMPVPIRDSLGIGDEQRNRPCYPKYVGDEAKSQLTEKGYEKLSTDGWVTVQTRVPSDAVREQYMFDKVLEKSKGAQSIMIICGIAHSQALAKPFRDRYGDCVQVLVLES